MNIKGFLFSAIFLSIAVSAIAQDKIFKSNGEVLDTKIRNVTSSSIVYVRYDNQGGPEYSISKNDVDKIKYQNGSEESFMSDRSMMGNDMMERRAHNEQLKGKYKENVIGFAPIQFTESGVAGFSFSYERVLDKNGIVAFYLPVIAELNIKSSTDYNGNTVNSNDPMFYVMPGIKLYPTGCYGIAKYAIGPSLVIADGSKTTSAIDPFGSAYYTSQSQFFFGMMVNQSININPTPHLYLGSELGMGFTYINQLAGVNQSSQFLVQFNFKIGYRF